MIILKIIYQYLRFIGFQKKRASEFAPLILDDFIKNPISIKKKVWAYRHGFLSSRIELYNLNKNNYKDYLSDVDYWSNHPYNNHFSFWINDKLTLKYMLSGLDDKLMPEYYLYIENDGRYSYLMDAPENIKKDKQFLFNLLKYKKILALKPNHGTDGAGFIKLSIADDGIIFSNNKKLKLIEFNILIEKLNGYIVTEYCQQHTQFNKIFKDTVCTLRIIVVKTSLTKINYDKDKYSVIASFARFGTKMSGGASNLSSGGVAVPFDFETGKMGSFFYQYKNFKFYDKDEITLSAHPDTGYVINGDVLPKHQEVKDSVFNICNYLSSLDYFGLDIIITPTGIKVCEINSLPALNYAQIMCGPVNKNADAIEFFKKKGINRHF